MRVCIPVARYSGLESPVFGHFGSAPCFALVDTETMAVEQLSNRDHEHVHGACSPIKALAGSNPDVILVGGIGMGALMRLRAAGIKVYRASGGTVESAVRQFGNNELAEIDENGVCAGHDAGHVCHSH